MLVALVAFFGFDTLLLVIGNMINLPTAPQAA
jgi:hypothetical protein